MRKTKGGASNGKQGGHKGPITRHRLKNGAIRNEIRADAELEKDAHHLFVESAEANQSLMSSDADSDREESEADEVNVNAREGLKAPAASLGSDQVLVPLAQTVSGLPTGPVVNAGVPNQGLSETDAPPPFSGVEGGPAVSRKGGPAFRTWKSVLTTETGHLKKLDLQFVNPPIVNGKNVADMDWDEWDRMNLPWNKALVFYPVGSLPPIDSVIRFISAAWKHVAQPKVRFHQEGYYVVFFQTIEECEKVLAGGVYTMGRYPIVLKKWTQDFNLHEELRVLPLWVRFPGLPVAFWGPNNLSRIASTLGVPVFADSGTANQTRLDYARVLIEVDITRERAYCARFRNEKGREIEQKVIYEWVPMFCDKCQRIGHKCPTVSSHNRKTQPARPQQGIGKQVAFAAKQIGGKQGETRVGVKVPETPPSSSKEPEKDTGGQGVGVKEQVVEESKGLSPLRRVTEGQNADTTPETPDSGKDPVLQTVVTTDVARVGAVAENTGNGGVVFKGPGISGAVETMLGNGKKILIPIFGDLEIDERCDPPKGSREL